MVDKNAKANNSQASDAEAKTKVFVENEPPKEQWATYEVIKNGEFIRSFKVPFTKEELDLITELLENANHPHLLKGYIAGGPERQHRMALRIPHEHGLVNRKYALDMLRSTARAVNKIISQDEFTTGLNSKEVILTIRDVLKPLLSIE